MVDVDREMLRIINLVRSRGIDRETRSGSTSSLFSLGFTIDALQYGKFPMPRGRKIFYKGILGEMATFLEGPRDVKHFEDNGCNYWKLWGDKKGKLNVDYGNAWIANNQLKNVVSSLKNDPSGRRHLIDAWNPENLDDLSLPCCHYAYQWYVRGDRLEMIWTQRSLDIMIGLPSDIVLASVFNILMAQTVGLKPGKISMNFGDCHIYDNHIDSVLTYIEQCDSLETENDTTYELHPDATVFNFKPDMLTINNYKPREVIKFELNA